MNHLAYGFDVLAFRKLDNWKILEITPEIPFAEQTKCPCDGSDMKTVCTLVGRKGSQKIRIGVCGSCGYAGYIDRPTRAWIDSFYADSWHIPEESGKEKIEKVRERFRQGKDRRINAVNIIERLKINAEKNLPVCEIGSGYGFTLKGMEKIGFRSLVGMESSLNRAEVARRAFGLRVLSSPFEKKSTQEELRKLSPFSVIFSHHVFEHVYDPNEVVSLCSALQKEGDFLILTMPNFKGEFSLSTIFYLPHLNAFSELSLKKLLHRHGYETIHSKFTTDTELCLVAQKKAVRSTLKPVEDGNYFAKAVRKFANYFRLDKKYKASTLFWGFRDVDIGGRILFCGNMVSRVIEAGAARLGPILHRKKIDLALGFSRGGNKTILSMIIQPLKIRYTDVSESPLEIQYDGNIKLSYK